MSLRKSSLYALHAAMDLARAGDGPPVTAAEVASRHGLPPAVVAKVFQRLQRSGLVHGTRGTAGGYRLALPPHRATMLDVVAVFEPGTPSRTAVESPNVAALRRVFEEIETTTRCTLASITLETLVGGPEVTGRRKAAAGSR